jgi:CHASE3 domain sensor protein
MDDQEKLYLGFGFVAAMMITGTVFEHWARGRAEANAQALAKTDSIQYDLEYLVTYIHSVTSAQRAYMISGDPSAIAGIPAMRTDADVVYARLQSELAGGSRPDSPSGALSGSHPGPPRLREQAQRCPQGSGL